jgi:hypothetical protein
LSPLLLKANLTAIYHLLGDWVDFNLHDVHSFVQPWECCWRPGISGTPGTLGGLPLSRT